MKNVIIYGTVVFLTSLSCSKDDKGRTNLVYEHTTPIGEFFKEILTFKSQKEVLDKLDPYSRIC
jgi:hypothetical protein